MPIAFDWNKEVKLETEEESKEENFNIKPTGMLQVDTREPDKVFNLLLKNGIKYEKVTLPIGDFVQDDVCIERKSMPDFIQSMRGGHLQKQVMQMEDSYARCFLIISGKHSEVAFNPHLKGWTVNHHMGALASMAVRYPKLKIIQVDNDTQLINLVARIMVKAFDGKAVTIQDTELMKVKMTDEDVKVKMLSCIPKVGLKKAKELREYIDIVLLDRATRQVLEEEHLFNIKGIGMVLSDEIAKINRE